MAKKNAIRTPASLATPGIYDRVSVDDLDFDPRNPRMVEYADWPKLTQKDLLRILWQEMAVDELALSISASGYFDYEPLFVATEKGRLVVIEGNRRLAAVKLLLDSAARQELRATDLPSISADLASSLERLPVIHTDRQKAWQYLGFKHVNGPALWDSYAKAQYVAEVHNGYLA